VLAMAGLHSSRGLLSQPFTPSLHPADRSVITRGG